MGLTVFRVEVRPCVAAVEVGQKYVAAAQGLGFDAVVAVRPSRLFFLEGPLSEADVARVAQELLADPVTEEWEGRREGSEMTSGPSTNRHFIETTLLPGVTDPAAENLAWAARLLGVEVARAATGMRFEVEGNLDKLALVRLGETVFANTVVAQVAVDRPITPPFRAYAESEGEAEIVALSGASDAELEAISQGRRLSLNLEEMQAIQRYFAAEAREPTDLELEMLAQTWSEHCVHKTFRAEIEYTGPDGRTEMIDGLLKSYIRAATEAINKDWVLSAFVDDAGIIAFNDEFDLAFKVETHNHPSALEPFGGANTGVGGVIRDVLGVGARPIANTDILCFGPQEVGAAELPEGVLHPRLVQGGVVAGVEDYGNKMGIPTVNGAIVYHAGYTANPLVYCGCLGLLPHGSQRTEARAGDLVVALGGRTGRDGLRGATFSSMEMDTSTGEIAGTAVQIGHPIQEKQVQEVILRARDEELYTALTDCGAGGFSSAVGEMAEGLGAAVQLADVPLKYPGLRPWEIWLSEAQERMVLAVPPAKVDRLLELSAQHDVEATVLGRFTGDGRLTIRYGERMVGDLDVEFLHEGLPRRRMTAIWSGEAAERRGGIVDPPTSWTSCSETLLQLLAHPNICSREEVVRRYDHEVQGGAVVRPLVGADNAGPSDGVVLVPLDYQRLELNTQPSALKGVTLSNGICPQFSAIDPYWMAWAAVDEAVRNAVAVGADPDQIAILDNFCWGNPNLPDRLGGLVRCAQGCYDAAVAYGTPFISGKDSLNNEYTGADGEKHAIPGTLLISAVSIVPDIARAMTMDLKAAGEAVYVVGVTQDEMGGTHWQLVSGTEQSANGQVPRGSEAGLGIMRAVHGAIAQGLVSAVHDCSEGGLAVALAEMALAGRLGVQVDVAAVPTHQPLQPHNLLYSESLSRFVVTTAEPAALEAHMRQAAIPFGRLGETAAAGFRIKHGEEVLVDLAVETLAEAFGSGEQRNVKCEKLIANRNGTVARTFHPSTFILHPAPKVAILHANGTNRDRDAALAVEMAGGRPEIVPVNQLLAGKRRLANYGMLVIPGGFSYGDDLGAGVLWAAALRHQLGEEIGGFVDGGRPVLGICNGFQVLVKAGVFGDLGVGKRPFTLTYNQSAQFECRWTYLHPNPQSNCLFTQGLDEPIYCPVAHGEGRFVVNELAAVRLDTQNRIALQYGDAAGVKDGYPLNPNGATAAIAGIANGAGNVLGLMPHPEDHIWPWQHPRWQRGERGGLGLRLFENGLKEA